ncbi:hypothetical protein LINGRAHAP2_LOCUS32944 [Linum grandiflorum]
MFLQPPFHNHIHLRRRSPHGLLKSPDIQPPQIRNTVSHQKPSRKFKKILEQPHQFRAVFPSREVPYRLPHDHLQDNVQRHLPKPVTHLNRNGAVSSSLLRLPVLIQLFCRQFNLRLPNVSKHFETVGGEKLEGRNLPDFPPVGSVGGERDHGSLVTEKIHG